MPGRFMPGCWPLPHRWWLFYKLPQSTEFDLKFMDVFVVVVHFYNGPGDQITAQNDQSEVENTKGNNQVQYVENIVIFGGGNQKSDYGQGQGQHGNPGSHNSKGCSFFRQEQLYFVDNNGIKFFRLADGVTLLCQ